MLQRHQGGDVTTSRSIGTKHTDRVRSEDAHTWLAAVIAVGGTALFLVGVAVLHVVERGVNPARHMVSEYALGAYGWIQTFDFLAAGVGAVALGIALARTNREPGRVGPLLIAGFGVSSLVVAFVQADGDGPITMHGSIHTLVSILGFAALVAGMFTFARRFRRDRSWLPMRTPTKVWAAASIGTFFLVPILGNSGQGVGQRIFIAVTFSWMLVAGARALTLSQSRRSGSTSRLGSGQTRPDWRA
jgi:hypothetical protein